MTPEEFEHALHRLEDDGGPPVTDDSRPFEIALFEALSFTADQVKKVDVSVGPRSQSITFKFALTTEQVAQLDAMARGH